MKLFFCRCSCLLIAVICLVNFVLFKLCVVYVFLFYLFFDVTLDANDHIGAIFNLSLFAPCASRDI